MNVMSREFTRSEKVLLVILSILLVGLIYYRFVYLTTEDAIESLEEDSISTEKDLEYANAMLDKLEGMKSEMDTIEIEEDVSRMESYNNSKNETAFLNQVLRGVEDYSVSFSDITRDGDQIRRSFSLQFVTKSYKDAVYVVEDLTNGEYRCLADDINYTLSDDDHIHIDLTATFFETMVGGTPDSALPEDSSDNGVDSSDGVSIDDFQ